MRARRSKFESADEIPNRKLSAFPEPMHGIGDIVLNNKKDIKLHKSAETRTNAAKFARQHNLLLGPNEDINGDGINDVALYDKKGNPVLINGYGVTPSEYTESIPNQICYKISNTSCWFHETIQKRSD